LRSLIQSERWQARSNPDPWFSAQQRVENHLLLLTYLDRRRLLGESEIEALALAALKLYRD
jgi:hypothetical protein